MGFPRLFLMTLAQLLLVSPVFAHGGDEAPASAGPWLTALIVVQLVLIPIIGAWLIAWTVRAWRPARLATGGQYETNE